MFFQLPTEQLPVEEKKSGGELRGCAFLGIALLSGLIGTLIGGLVVALFVPYLLGLNFSDLLAGKLPKIPAVGKTLSPKEIKIKSYYRDPVVAIAKKVQPSVVNIRIEKVMLVEDFFGPFYEKVKGAGSGVIIREDGYILTNNHVIQDANEIWVTLPSGEDVKGKVVGKDKENDIAIVKVEKDSLPAVEVGTSKGLEVGQLVVAIGNPFGFAHTVTAGVISALNRTVSTPDEEGNIITYTDLIQTDAAINPGNSGGALCDSEGKLIGINTLIYSKTGGYQGIGFAIPIDTAMSVADQLMKTGKVSHPFIGITGASVTEEIASQHGLPTTQGALVVDVLPGTPAAKVGLRRGDIIIKLDNAEIKSMDDLISETRKRKVGDIVNLIYLRGKERKEVKVRLAEKTGFIR